ncbi:uncharacterized protein H6S33_008924 [Morchella sextelata]|uniref:uncharacterized protein n=1 Tax=Morchella sextelata TaxID=1174677 RepID=UPI001D049485|nr:uncharacterized protein H6S33_008924 [Morchella sextelata]KAH0612544.1 hypothetical protein H6S33_008924 [Morchella sextelata]
MICARLYYDLTKRYILDKREIMSLRGLHQHNPSHRLLEQHETTKTRLPADVQFQEPPVRLCVAKGKK